MSIFFRTFAVEMKICAKILGLVFVVSAFAKAWEADVFALTLLGYGPEWFGIWAPVIIVIEVVLGMCLLIDIQPRKSAIAADVFLVAVSAVFAYGVVAKGMEDCGCFGALERYYTAKPWMTFARNAVLIGLTIPILIKGKKGQKQEGTRHLPQKLIAMMAVVAVACFICGLAMKSSFRLPEIGREEEEDKIGMCEKLERIYSLSADSSYMVYLFSYTCPYCQNSYANVMQYGEMGLVDKVVGVAVEDAEARARFERIYGCEMEVREIAKDSMSAITHELPVAVVIRKGEIEEIKRGMIASPGIYIK